MVIAQYDLDGVQVDRGRQVTKGCDRHVAGQRRLDAFLEQSAPDLGHAVETGGRVLEITTAREFLGQCLTDPD